MPLGMNAQAWNTPGGIYDRFAGLMGVLAQAPNDRRKVELSRQTHADDLAERKREHDQDYELKKMYYASLMGKPPAGTAEANNLAWRQSIEQNPTPVKDIRRNDIGEPVTGSNGEPVFVDPGAPNYAVVGGDSGWPSHNPNTIQTPDIRQQLADEAKAQQMSAYQEAIGQEWAPPAGVAQLQAKGENPYMTGPYAKLMATRDAGPAPSATAPPAYAGANPYGDAVAGAAQPPAAPVPVTKVTQFRQLGGPMVQPEQVPALFSPDKATRDALLDSMSLTDQIAASRALMQLGYD